MARRRRSPDAQLWLFTEEEMAPRPVSSAPAAAPAGALEPAPVPTRAEREAQAEQSRLDRMLDAAITTEVAERGGVLPPWLRFPGAPRFGSFWNQGGGEWFVMVWTRWARDLDERARVAYFARHAPVPVPWSDWVASAVYGDREYESDDELLDDVRRLEEEHGLVSADAFEEWLVSEGG
jgi:hypothetical protein